jgi:Lipoprotein NlpI, contains TPR repeats
MTKSRKIKALGDYNKAVEINPDNYQTYHNRGILFIQTGKYENALKDFDACLEKYPNFVWAMEKRAEVLGKLGRHREAQRDLNKAKELMKLWHKM